MPYLFAYPRRIGEAQSNLCTKKTAIKFFGCMPITGLRRYWKYRFEVQSRGTESEKIRKYDVKGIGKTKRQIVRCFIACSNDENRIESFIISSPALPNWRRICQPKNKSAVICNNAVPKKRHHHPQMKFADGLHNFLCQKIRPENNFLK